MVRFMIVMLWMMLMISCTPDTSVSSSDPLPTQPPNPQHGRVIGVVKDADGQPIVRASLGLVSGPGPIIEMAALTNERGEYEWTDLTAGEWTLSAHADGFKGKELKVRVPAGGTATLDFTLEP